MFCFVFLYYPSWMTYHPTLWFRTELKPLDVAPRGSVTSEIFSVLKAQLCPSLLPFGCGFLTHLWWVRVSCAAALQSGTEVHHVIFGKCWQDRPSAWKDTFRVSVTAVFPVLHSREFSRKGKKREREKGGRAGSQDPLKKGVGHIKTKARSRDKKMNS